MDRETKSKFEVPNFVKLQIYNVLEKSEEQNDEDGDSSSTTCGVSVVLDILSLKLQVEGGGPSEGSSSWIPFGVGRHHLFYSDDEAADEMTFDSASSNVSLRHFLLRWSSLGGENSNCTPGWGGRSRYALSIVSWNAAVPQENPLNRLRK
jgi:hypothetical protein